MTMEEFKSKYFWGGCKIPKIGPYRVEASNFGGIYNGAFFSYDEQDLNNNFEYYESFDILCNSVICGRTFSEWINCDFKDAPLNSEIQKFQPVNSEVQKLKPVKSAIQKVINFIKNY